MKLKKTQSSQPKAPVKTTGFITTWIDGNDGTVTLGTIRKWLQTCDRLGIKDDTELLECLISIDIEVDEVEPIECGECTQKDVLVVTHDCPGYAPWMTPPSTKKKTKKGQ